MVLFFPLLELTASMLDLPKPVFELWDELIAFVLHS
jgi:hypothetical protein